MTKTNSNQRVNYFPLQNRCKQLDSNKNLLNSKQRRKLQVIVKSQHDRTNKKRPYATLVKQTIETICTLGKTHHEEWFNQFGQCTWWTFF